MAFVNSGGRCMVRMLRGLAPGRTHSTSGWTPPAFVNEIPNAYEKGSQARNSLDAALRRTRASFPAQIPINIGAREANSSFSGTQINPSKHAEVVAQFSQAVRGDVHAAVDAALATRRTWGVLPFEARASVFLRAAELVATKYRYDIVAATMLGQGKNAWQAEIDAAAEICDFFRAYVVEGWRMETQEQPKVRQSPGVSNHIQYRGLDGFVYAVSPFNFTALGATLAGAPALMGNPVIWKPSPSAVHASWLLHRILLEAGLPEDVIQFLPGDAEMITHEVFTRREFAGLSFIGSSAVLQKLTGQIGAGTAAGRYKNFPRIVGETGGKNFHVVHRSADLPNAVRHTVRAAFELAGQKCSACSRLYVASSVWPQFRELLVQEVDALRVGDPEVYENFVNAVIHERAFDSLTSTIHRAETDPALSILVGGHSDKSVGYYVHPTVIQTQQADHDIMTTELFGPILGVYVYPDGDWEDILRVVDATSPYALTGAVFAQDPLALRTATDALRDCAGNFYINSKCTGATVQQQSFGGARASGTNDKSGTMGLLSRWASARTIKQQFDTIPSTLYRSNER